MKTTSFVDSGSRMINFAGAFAVTVSISAGVSAADGQVKVTPLGSHTGEFCARDRALVFEDPNGTRILYDAGQTVAGADDERLGKIDIVLVSHMHGDHVGNQRIESVVDSDQSSKGSCAAPDTSVSALPATVSVAVAVAKDATMVTGSEMPAFFAQKLKAAGGKSESSKLVRFGGSLEVGGISITTVPAVHSNGVSADIIGGTLGELLQAAGVQGYAGPPTGYVLTFSNGLVAYLSGDTGITAEQESVVRDYYKAKLAVMNIGDMYTTGPAEAAHVVNDMVEPASVIPSHANEAATQKGTVVKGTKTAAFIEAASMPVHVPLSGVTMSFDSAGKCVDGCRE